MTKFFPIFSDKVAVSSEADADLLMKNFGAMFKRNYANSRHNSSIILMCVLREIKRNAFIFLCFISEGESSIPTLLHSYLNHSCLLMFTHCCHI